MTDTKEIERAVTHRPWPLPRLPWVLFQSWQRLLFAHWALPAERLRPLVPARLELESFDGYAWLGITPFMLAGFRPRILPAIPGVSDFPELNLRTYVRVGDRPGIHFFSLDAGSRAAVLGARTWFRLPYHHAAMRIEGDETDWIRFRSRRDDGEAEFVARYRPAGAVSVPEPGTLEYFLTERYALYTVLRDGTVLRGDIHHRPWRLQPAEAEITRNELAAASGIALPDGPPLLHFAARQDTLIWSPMKLDGSGRESA